ncbi:MAG: HEAT repeat domain-containing protein [Actinomycetota bacterium]|nr:HEAT repeat domain-containing protein [Actinomycetota bacterium]
MGDDFARLRTLLDDSDPDVRGMVAVALANISGPQATDMLLELAGDADSRVVCAAVQSLGARGEKRSVPVLIRLMQRDETDVKCSALAALAQVADPQAFPAVVTAMFDVDDQVRRNATAAIGRLGDKRALEPLYEMLHDGYRWVRANAALSLKALADPGSAAPLAMQLDEEDDDLVRGNLLMALMSCDGGRYPLLVTFLNDPDEGEKTRVAAALAMPDAASALPEVSSEAMLTALARQVNAAGAPDEVRAACAWALGRMPHRGSSIDALCDALDDPYEWTVLYALESLALLKDVRAEGRIRAFRSMHEDDGKLVEHVDAALKELEAVEARD